MTLPAKILLWFPSEIYRFITGTRNRLYDLGILKSHSFRIPVICVGNITAGGTGKTPHVMYLADKLSEVTEVAVLSRGYLRKSKGFRRVHEADAVADTGDEPLMIARNNRRLKVFVDRNRVRGINEIMKAFPSVGAVILDDGFQHRAVKAGINIVLTSYGRLMTRDHMIPMGRLRESLSAIRRADIIIITKVPPGTTPGELNMLRNELPLISGHNLFFTGMIYKNPVHLFSGLVKEVTHETSVVLLTGIADPMPLMRHVSSVTKKITHIAFPDHHRFTSGDLARVMAEYNKLPGDDRMIITTEKDAVRLKEITNIADRLREALYFLPVGIRFIDNEEEFLKIIYGYAGKDKKDR